MVSIIKVADRAKLKPRREPYWQRLSVGQYVGYRRMTAGTVGQWQARYLERPQYRKIYKAIGTFEHLPENERYSAASKAAREWFEHLDQGGSHQTLTIRDACARYVAHLRRSKGDKAAQDAEQRFERHVFDDPRFSAAELEKLKAPSVKKWRERLEDRPTATGAARTASATNRDMTALRSALNLAKADGFITSDAAWKTALLPTPGADKSRGVYLDAEQRAALIAAAPADLALLLRAQCLLPVRPGAMAQRTAGDFDARLGTIRVGSDKAGAGRTIQLPAATARFFTEQAANKLPGAWLFTRADGEQWNKDNWKGPFREAADQAGLPTAATLYALRHSVITDLVHSGADLLTVSQIAGTGLRMIEQHYGHLRGAVAARALEALAL